MANIGIIYWSGSGNTQAMAELVAEGVRSAGGQAALLQVGDADPSAPDQYDALALGCPSMGDETLEEDEFEPFIQSIEASVSGKKLALFGSYGWGDGQWMRDWTKRMSDAGAVLAVDSLIVNDAPAGEDAENCKKLGADLATA